MAVIKGKMVEEGRRMQEPMTPPEGGWGWMIVAGCFLANICVRALTRCVSMFFVEFQLHFEKDYASTAWIYSLIDSVTMLCAPLGGFLGNRFSCRTTVILGGLLSSAGLVLSSFATCLEYLYISAGILTGLGFALSYTPAVAMVGSYFAERKALAYGIALSGSGIGTFILAPVVQLLIENYSWRGALLVLGGFVSNLCVCGALMRPLKQQRKGNQRIWENNMVNLKKSMTTVMDIKNTDQLPAVFIQEDPKHLETNKSKNFSIHLTNMALQNCGVENDKLVQMKLAEVLLSNLPDPKLTEKKMNKHISFSNVITETVLGEWKVSELNTDINTPEDLKPVETMNLNNKAADIVDEKIEDLKLSEHLALAVPLSDPQTSTRGHCFSLKSKEEFSFLLTSDFLILSISILFMAYGCSAPIVYLVPYAVSVGVDHQSAALLMSMFGVSGIVGNITFGWITDRPCLRKYRMLSYMLAVSLEGLLCMFLPFLHSFPLLVPFSILYGYFDGAYVALIPVVTSDVVGSTYLTSALGVVYFLHAIPYLISPPLGGLLVDKTTNYTATFFLSSTSFMVSAIILAAGMLVRHCRRSKANTVM
ncbi:monocarboxylate transporter 12-B-like [Sphaeramia orbicularis]|uniref:monocarboxylate transporter 12-B-like n=1 Tax=Sphaeramia orbicularis TaxID=375764 RepID=UPI00117CCB84|nr:monocarboxylate transporter 12-B-like [Sphaeramia orbicularis]